MLNLVLGYSYEVQRTIVLEGKYTPFILCMYHNSITILAVSTDKWRCCFTPMNQNIFPFYACFSLKDYYRGGNAYRLCVLVHDLPIPSHPTSIPRLCKYASFSTP